MAVMESWSQAFSMDVRQEGLGANSGTYQVKGLELREALEGGI